MGRCTLNHPMNKYQERTIERRRKKRIASEHPTNPKINRDYIPNRFSTIKDFFKSDYCLSISNPATFDHTGGVYFLTYVGDESKIKIGKGRILDRRVRDYLTSHYRDIKILCYVHSQKDMHGILEKDFHNFFYQSKYDREWYTATDFLLKSIEEIKQINNFVPFVIPRKGQDIYEDPDYLRNMMRSHL